VKVLGRRVKVLVALILVVIAAAGGVTIADRMTAATVSTRDISIGKPCGIQRNGASITHVIWVWMENESLPMIVGSPHAPYQTALARGCGLATNYFAITHPSLPNYLAATGGSTFGVVDDAEPAAHRISAPSLFSQISAAHGSWRGYVESMPTTCDLVTSGAYAARHNPAVYYIDLRNECAHDDVPMGSISDGAFAKAARSGRLPSFAFVTPNICDDAHSCPVAHGDSWLEQFLPTLFASPQYRKGQVVLFLAYDEGGGENRVAMIVVSPSVPHGVVSTVPYTHYSLLRSTEELLRLPLLRSASSARSMVSAFNLRSS